MAAGCWCTSSWSSISISAAVMKTNNSQSHQPSSLSFSSFHYNNNYNNNNKPSSSSSSSSFINPIFQRPNIKTLFKPPTSPPRCLPSFQVVSLGSEPEPLKVMISGAPASGKGTQCQLITKKYNLVHIAAGDLLRAEISSGSENGKQAKEYMEKGQLVPNEIVVMMVKDRLLQLDAQENGWLLDGYPRSLSQATALEKFGIKPDIFILLEVSEEALVERVVGRRLDPVTGKIYHLKYSPPETEEIAERLTQRFDDTEEKVKLRLQTHHQNVESVLSMYEAITVKLNGNASQEDVFAEIDNVLSDLIERKKTTARAVTA